MSRETTIKEGDTVRVANIQGPVMTVQSVTRAFGELGGEEAATPVICQWFVEGDKLQEGHFALASLEKVDKAPANATPKD